MELLTIGYEGRTLPQFVRTLEENGVTRLVDVRERPQSRKKGFSARGLFDSLQRAGITYESDPRLGNPIEIRDLWKTGELRKGRARYRALLRNGRGSRVQFLVDLAKYDRVCILCYEGDAEACHRSVIAEEAACLEPRLKVVHL